MSSRFYPDGLLRLGFSQGSVLGRYGIWFVLDFGGRGRFAVIDGPLFVEVHEHVSRGSDQWNADDDAPQSRDLAGHYQSDHDKRGVQPDGVALYARSDEVVFDDLNDDVDENDP